MLQSIFWMIPKTLSLVANSQVLPDALCCIQEHLIVFIGITIAWLTPVLTTSKLLLIKYPFRSENWTKNKRAHLVCCLCFVPAVLVTTTKVIVDSDDVSFDFRVYVCRYKSSANIWKVLLPIVAFIVFVLPNTILIATTIPTLKYFYTASKSARRVQGSIPWQGAVTVSLTAIVYCISFLPLSIYFVGEIFVEASFLEVHFYRFAESVSAISIMSNFYIYALTIKSFRRFVFSKILALDRFNVNSNSAEGGSRTGEH